MMCPVVVGPAPLHIPRALGWHPLISEGGHAEQDSTLRDTNCSCFVSSWELSMPLH